MADETRSGPVVLPPAYEGEDVDVYVQMKREGWPDDIGGALADRVRYMRDPVAFISSDERERLLARIAGTDSGDDRN